MSRVRTFLAKLRTGLVDAWSWKRALWWALFGGVTVAVITMRDISELLRAIETSGDRAFDATVFTGPHLTFWNTSDLAEAITTWNRADFDVTRLLRWHLRIDAFAFAPLYTLLLWQLLLHVGAEKPFSAIVSLTLFLVDEAETLFSDVVLVGGELQVTNVWLLRLLQLLSLTKWILLSVALVTLLLAWRNSRTGKTSTNEILTAVGRSRHGKKQSPAIALSGLLVLIVLFGALVALPAGGPLEQLPDVLRNHLSEGDIELWTFSNIGLLLFAAAVAVAGAMATSHARPTASTSRLSWRLMVLGAIGLSAVLSAIDLCIDGEWDWGAFAPAFLVLGLTIAAGIARWAGVHGKPASEAQLKRIRESESDEPSSRVWVGGLAGAVYVIGSLGLIRAAFPPFILRIQSGAFSWGWATFFGVVGAIVAGVLIQTVVVYLTGLNAPVRKRLAAVTVVLAVVGCTTWLMLSPDSGRTWGATGVVGVSLAFWSFIVGGLTWLSRSGPRWEITRNLGFGERTPWPSLFLLTLLTATALNADSGYHDARVGAKYGSGSPEHRNLNGAFDTWKTSQPRGCRPSSEQAEPIPMVLVAAPGGGIRAAYWTAAVLDRLFGTKAPRCARASLFAVSGVSGGSVGTAAWLAASAKKQPGTPAVTRMSEDRALSSALVGLMLRDAIQPLVGLDRSWADRAALLEDGWIHSAEVFGSVKKPLAFSDLSNGTFLPFVPVVALNGSSVTDGCRVVVANVRDFTTSSSTSCQALPGGNGSQPGRVTAAIDAFHGLLPNETDNTNCDYRGIGMRAVTGALLSARFPVVSPSGAFHRCTDENTTTTSAVDGGYYENSGLLTLVQMWEEVEPSVRRYNEKAVSERRSTIEPWILVADNHYQGVARRVAASSRPNELLVPLIGKTKQVLTDTMLEQVAFSEMRAPGLKGGFLHLAPTIKPSVAAPLGWVLSEPSRTNLENQLTERLQDCGTPERFLTLLGIPRTGPVCP